jgi:hypothetical protein
MHPEKCRSIDNAVISYTCEPYHRRPHARASTRTGLTLFFLPFVFYLLAVGKYFLPERREDTA